VPTVAARLQSAVEAPTPKVEEPYRRLLRLLHAARGMFALVLVESHLSASERDQLFGRLRDDLASDGMDLEIAQLRFDAWDPLAAIEQLRAGRNGDAVVLLQGLERTPPAPFGAAERRRPPAFARLNQAREAIEHCLGGPLVVWCENGSFNALRRYAPDFFDHFAGLVHFEEAGGPHAAERRVDGAVRVVDQAELETVRSPPPAAPESGIRFYEARLESTPPGSRERALALLGLAESLLGLPGQERAAAAGQASSEVADALLSLSPERDPEQWARAKELEAGAAETRGQFDVALAASVEAVEVRRRQTAEQPDVGIPELADSLRDLGIRFGVLGRLHEALEVTREAVGLYRELATDRPDDFLSYLATGLLNLGAALSDLGEIDEALVAAREAVDIQRQLGVDAARPLLAKGLTNLGVLLSDLGRREEALEATREAVEHHYRLAAHQPDAFLPGLAVNLNNLGIMLGALGRREEALVATQQAIELQRQLAVVRPEVLPDLAMSLNNLGIRLSDAGQAEAALDALREAVDLRRQLNTDRPEAFGPGLAVSLGNLGVSLALLGRSKEAHAMTEEAVRQLAPFFLKFPAAFRRWMASLVEGYRMAAEAVGEEPDPALLKPIVELLDA